MDQQYPIVAKIPVLDTRKFEQWQFQMQQYLQREHYALWEVIEFRDSYEVPANDPSTTTTNTTSGEASTKSRRTVTLTTEDMQKKNDVKARTTLLLSLPDEHQLRFSKYKTARELWAVILKTFGRNEATKKMKKNLLKRQYGNFRAEGSKTLEQTFTRLQVIVGQLQFMDVEVEQDDLNQTKHSRGNDDVNTASVYTASSNVPTGSENVATVSISQETTRAYIAFQSSGSQIKFEDINQIDEDDMEEMDIKWNLALLSMGADKFWKKTRKKISIQGSDVAGFDKSKVECFNCHKMGHFARECRAPRNQDRGRRDNYRQGSKAKEHDPKALMAIDGELETLKQEKEVVDGKLAGLLTASKDLNNLIKSQRSDKSKEGLGYTVVPPPPAQLYLSLKKDLSSTGLPESSPITPKPFVKFVKASDSQSKSKTDEKETPKKPPVKYVKQYRKPNKKPNVRGNKRNWNNLKSHQLGPDSVMKKKHALTVATCPTYLIMNHLKDDMCLLGKEDARLPEKELSKLNSVLFPDSECIVLGRDFKLLDDANILLRTPRQHNMYSIDLNNIVPHRDLTCLVAKASADECMIWHRRLVVTDDFSRFTWTFFLKSKDETSDIVKKFITEIENLKDLKVKIIRSPQQNGVAEKRNRSLIEAASTMLADAKLPVTFWAEAVNTACYVQNRVLVNKAHNKTSYELFNGRTPAIGFLKPFGCYVMILNTLDNLGKFEAKGDEGYFLGYSMSNKAFRVFNKRTKRVEENLHIEFLENKAIEKGSGPNWLFDIDSLTKSMNYVPVVDACTHSTNFSGIKVDARQDVMKDVSSLRYIVLPNWVHEEHLESTSSQPQDACNTDAPESSGNSNPTATSTNPPADQLETLTVETPIPTFEDILGVTSNEDESNGVEANVSNMETTITASPTPILRIHRNHPKSHIIGHVDTPIQTRNKSKEVLKNKKDERGTVIRNKARLVAQGHTQEEGIDYDEAIRVKLVSTNEKEGMCHVGWGQ
nr:hypothetical protein [Tanacetum cinerariifolium]